jgi:hypothetical protein
MARKPRDDKAALRRFARMAVLIDEPIVEEVEESKRNPKLCAPRGGGPTMANRLSAEELVGKRLSVGAMARVWGNGAPPGLSEEEWEAAKAAARKEQEEREERERTNPLRIRINAELAEMKEKARIAGIEIEEEAERVRREIEEDAQRKLREEVRLAVAALIEEEAKQVTPAAVAMVERDLMERKAEHARLAAMAQKAEREKALEDAIVEVHQTSGLKLTTGPLGLKLIRSALLAAGKAAPGDTTLKPAVSAVQKKLKAAVSDAQKEITNS